MVGIFGTLISRAIFRYVVEVKDDLPLIGRSSNCVDTNTTVRTGSCKH
jgi:hypothetical protein